MRTFERSCLACMQALRKAAAAGMQPGPAPPSSLGAWLAQVAVYNYLSGAL